MRREADHIIRFSLLLFNLYCDIKVFSANAKNGKIACWHISERGGHRLKAALVCVAWFARERPVRAGRRALRYGAKSVCCKAQMRVVPRKVGLSSLMVGRKGFFISLYFTRKEENR